jgi:hypothetical protein
LKRSIVKRVAEIVVGLGVCVGEGVLLSDIDGEDVFDRELEEVAVLEMERDLVLEGDSDIVRVGVLDILIDEENDREKEGDLLSDTVREGDLLLDTVGDGDLENETDDEDVFETEVEAVPVLLIEVEAVVVEVEVPVIGKQQRGKQRITRNAHASGTCGSVEHATQLPSRTYV